ncbi:hypothetical protein HMPREF0372_02092 [Flavonifractor plautii ATCC 29863]|uniref:Uncharacterized protein n=1 Tax=Flavonifractor plautii ATCC 29863 TaxID=411475 RepID=G9YRE5_FLAPL|nr:hypothetical protein HMPREF0372_02092 [Flavonifractor plautii ATCC 29863]
MVSRSCHLLNVREQRFIAPPLSFFPILLYPIQPLGVKPFFAGPKPLCTAAQECLFLSPHGRLQLLECFFLNARYLAPRLL